MAKESIKILGIIDHLSSHIPLFKCISENCSTKYNGICQYCCFGDWLPTR